MSVPEHREEALGRALDVRVVDALLVHGRVAVQQVVARDAHAVEPDPAVVHAVEPELGAAVLDPDAGERLAVLGAQRDEQRVHAALLAADDQLGEHGGHAAVARGVADPRLVRRVLGRVDLELAGLGVVGRRGAQVLDVGAVALLGHREAAGQLQRGDVGQVALVVLLRAEVLDGAAEQAELHAELDEQRQVAERHRLEARDVAADVAVAAVLLRVAGGRLAARGQVLGPGEHLLAVLLEGEIGAGSVALHRRATRARGRGPRRADRRGSAGTRRCWWWRGLPWVWKLTCRSRNARRSRGTARTITPTRRPLHAVNSSHSGPAPSSSTSARTRSTPSWCRGTSSTSRASRRCRSASPARCWSTASTPRASSTCRWRPPRGRSSPPTTAA